MFWVLHGQKVQCLSADWQVRVVHSGYEPRPEDLHDLAVLAALTDPDDIRSRDDCVQRSASMPVTQ